jgi:hypothetical protein
MSLTYTGWPVMSKNNMRRQYLYLSLKAHHRPSYCLLFCIVERTLTTERRSGGWRSCGRDTAFSARSSRNPDSHQDMKWVEENVLTKRVETALPDRILHRISGVHTMQQSFQEGLKNVTAASMISRIGRNLALELRTSQYQREGRQRQLCEWRRLDFKWQSLIQGTRWGSTGGACHEAQGVYQEICQV